MQKFAILLTIILTGCSGSKYEGLTAAEWANEYYAVYDELTFVKGDYESLQYDFDDLEDDFDDLEEAYSDAKSCSIIWGEDTWWHCF